MGWGGEGGKVAPMDSASGFYASLKVHTYWPSSSLESTARTQALKTLATALKAMRFSIGIPENKRTGNGWETVLERPESRNTVRIN